MESDGMFLRHRETKAKFEAVPPRGIGVGR